MDEVGKGVPYVWVKFVDGSQYRLVRADQEGIARYRSASGNAVGATFDDLEELSAAVGPSWDQTSRTARNEWLKPEGGKRSVLSIRGGNLQQLLPSSIARGTSGSEATERFATFAQVVLKPGEEHLISLQPHVTMLRLLGMYFDSNKCFLLPTAVERMRRIRQHYDEHSTAHLLVVGHTDTTADEAYNETLSVERADAVLAYLRDDVEAWLRWYEPSVPDKKRWGNSEDLGML